MTSTLCIADVRTLTRRCRESSSSWEVRWSTDSVALNLCQAGKSGSFATMSLGWVQTTKNQTQVQGEVLVELPPVGGRIELAAIA